MINNHMLIYKITNTINQKRYIGCTVREIDERFNDHILNSTKTDRSKSAIADAILKYGSENFIIEQIDTAENPAEMYEKEISWIAQLGTYQIEYNLTKGGEGSAGRVLTNETKEKMRVKAVKRFSDPIEREKAAKKRTEFFAANPEEKLKNSDRLKEYYKTHRVSDKTRELISRGLKGKSKNWTADGKAKIAESNRTRIPPKLSSNGKQSKINFMSTNNPMNSLENRNKVGISKLGKKKFMREDGSYYMAYPPHFEVG